MKDRVAVVTGASRGIGRAICLAMARRGATVIACARTETALSELAQNAKAADLAGAIEPHVLDVSDRAALDPFVERVAQSHRRVDILINNAGITRDSLLMNMDDDELEQVLTTNLRAVIWLTRAISRMMVRQRYGRITNVGSVTGVMGNPGQSNYAASKAGLIGFSKTVAKELGKRKITCNVVAPGFIETDMTSTLPEKVRMAFLEWIPLGRMGNVDEVAEVVAFLSSDAASYVTGQVLLVDGGLRM